VCVYVYIYISIYHYLSIYLSIYLFIYLSIYLSIYLWFYEYYILYLYWFDPSILVQLEAAILLLNHWLGPPYVDETWLTISKTSSQLGNTAGKQNWVSPIHTWFRERERDAYTYFIYICLFCLHILSLQKVDIWRFPEIWVPQTIHFPIVCDQFWMILGHSILGNLHILNITAWVTSIPSLPLL